MDRESARFSPFDHYATESRPRPRVFGAPMRYIQGPGEIDRVGHHVAPFGFASVAVLASPGRRKALGARLGASFERVGITARFVDFAGESSLAEIGRLAKSMTGSGIDGLVAVGGGKAIDTGKSVAARLDVPLAIVPTLASNDAPCSAASVLYTDDHVDAGVEFFPRNPLVVIVDTAVIAEAGERYLVAGMGDALATWYEARACAESPDGVAVIGGRPTVAGLAIAERCADVLYADGVAAAKACRLGVPNDALERVVEANTLLSGLGFESGGLASAHSIAQGLTAVPAIVASFLHGELVAIGTLMQLALEAQDEDLRRAAAFCTHVGLPVTLEQIGFDVDDASVLEPVLDLALAFPPIVNEPAEVTRATLTEALREADRAGRDAIDQFGDDAFRRLHASMA